jgi:hypothetical protein
MEVVVWYLGEESRARDLRENHGQGWPEVELSQFMGDFLFIPLFSILIDNARPIGHGEILDKHLYADPDLEDEQKLADGTARGCFVERVNPRFVGRLAEIAPEQIPSLADRWYAAPEMRDFYRRWGEQEARQEVVRILTELLPLARRAVAENKALMQLSSL